MTREGAMTREGGMREEREGVAVEVREETTVSTGRVTMVKRVESFYSTCGILSLEVTGEGRVAG
jgi:hypothetical protein